MVSFSFPSKDSCLYVNFHLVYLEMICFLGVLFFFLSMYVILLSITGRLVYWFHCACGFDTLICILEFT